MSKMVRFTARTGVVLFWVVVGLGFLFLPRIRRLFPEKKSIALLVWPTDVDQKILVDFERETGIAVHVSYFEDYEEFFVKLKTTKGEGYDLVTPADYIVPALVRQGLLKRLDHTQLSFLDALNQDLMGHYFDPKNTYTIPYFWGIFGIGIDRSYFANMPAATWRLIFDKDAGISSIGMVQDARELILIAARYLFGELPEKITDEQLEQLKKLLLEQKKRVALYTDTRAGYLLASHSCPAVLTISYEVGRAMREHPHIDFLIPEEGSFLIIDNFAIPASSTKEKLVYKLLNYLYRPEVVRRLVEKQLFYPPTTNAIPHDFFTVISEPNKEQLEKARFFKEVVTEEQLSSVWLALKS